MKVSVQYALVCAVLTMMGGCATLEDAKYETTQKLRAKSAYAKHNKADCERYPKDYKLGWLDGFYSTSTGGPNCPPAIAPQRYWKTSQILKDCDNRRHAFYSGWQDGAACASQFPDTHFLRVFENCECPVPRCELACPSGDCGLLVHDSLGTPIHDELLEVPLVAPPASVPVDSESETSKPMGTLPPVDPSGGSEPLLPPAETTEQELVPPAPAGEAMPKSEKAPTSSLPPEPNVVGQKQTTTPTTIELKTDAISQAPTEQSLRESGADSILGKAFDLLPYRQSTVKLQSIDPVDELTAESEKPSEPIKKAEPLPTSSRRVVDSLPAAEDSPTPDSPASQRASLVQVAAPMVVVPETATDREPKPVKSNSQPVALGPVASGVGIELGLSDLAPVPTGPMTTVRTIEVIDLPSPSTMKQFASSRSNPAVPSSGAEEKSIVRAAKGFKIEARAVRHRSPAKQDPASKLAPVVRSASIKFQPQSGPNSVIQEASQIEFAGEAPAVGKPSSFQMIESNRLHVR